MHRFAPRLFALIPLLVALGWAHPASASLPIKVVGNGQPGSCNAEKLAQALVGGGSISFNCVPAEQKIVVTQPFDVTATATVVDGGGVITLEVPDGTTSRIFNHRTFGTIGSSVLTLRNLTLKGGRAEGGGDTAGNANGGAISSVFGAADPAFKPSLVVENVIFTNNDVRLLSVPAGRDAYDYGGGAIYSRGGAVTVRNSQFVDNDAFNGAGGAIHILQSRLTISGSSFSNNTAIGATPRDSFGGAISIDGLGGPGGVFRVERSSFSNNRAYNSGGAIHVNMYEDSSSTQIVDSSFTGNAVVGGSQAQGGAIGGGGTNNGPGTGNPSITVSGSLFSGNSVRRTAGADGNPREDGSGGALAFPQRARLSITSSTFEGNRAHGSGFNANGGALYVVNHTVPFVISGSTFANNTAGWVGGAISNSQVGNAPGGRVSTTIFSNNSADNGPNSWNIQQHCSSELAHDGLSLQHPPRLTGGNFWNDVTCFAGKSAPGQTGDAQFRNPQLVALADNGGPTRTMAITTASPAYNGGGATCPGTDQRGVARPQAGSCDLGAYELVVRLSVGRWLIAVDDTQRTRVVSGAGFSAGSTVRVNGASRPTRFISAIALEFDLTEADVAAVGDLTISVDGPGSELQPATVKVVAELFSTWLPVVRQ